MKGAILYSTQNAASLNIMRHLEADWAWNRVGEKANSPCGKNKGATHFFSPCGEEDCEGKFEACGFENEIIAITPEDAIGAGATPADYYLYASTHKSAEGKPALTAHIPGNWNAAQMGGQPRTLNMAYASKLKQIMKLLDEGNKKHGLNWQLNMEVDHHGPTPEGGKHKLIFVEIGSKEGDWENELAGKVVAEAMMKALFREAPIVPVYLGFGGGHYSPKFTPYMLGGSGAVAHVLPKYQAESFDAKMLKEAIAKTHEKVEGALVDWKGLPGEHRERITTLIEEEGMRWEKI